MKAFHAADGRPLSKLKRSELVALASMLEANVAGKARDFGSDPNELAGTVPAIDPRDRAKRKWVKRLDTCRGAARRGRRPAAVLGAQRRMAQESGARNPCV